MYVYTTHTHVCCTCNYLLHYKHTEHSNQPLEQRSLKSSCSSGSIGGGGVDDDVSSSSEVTGGGKVFVVKQQRSDSEHVYS